VQIHQGAGNVKEQKEEKEEKEGKKNRSQEGGG
jgi:hypothetical protein